MLLSKLLYFYGRTWRVEAEVPSLLVQVRSHLPYLGVLSKVDENQENGQPNCDGPIYGPSYYHLHCTEHIIYGHGAPPNETMVQKHVDCGKPGKPTRLVDAFLFQNDKF